MMMATTATATDELLGRGDMGQSIEVSQNSRAVSYYSNHPNTLKVKINTSKLQSNL